MPSITEIQQAILVLPKDEYARLREWLSDLDWERWDKHARLDRRSVSAPHNVTVLDKV